MYDLSQNLTCNKHLINVCWIDCVMVSFMLVLCVTLVRLRYLVNLDLKYLVI